jgi:hypothetical protein
VAGEICVSATDQTIMATDAAITSRQSMTCCCTPAIESVDDAGVPEDAK